MQRVVAVFLKDMFSHKKFILFKMKNKNKRGMSVIIGYVLLIVFAAVMGVIVYQWQKTYTPQDSYGACPDESSLMITSLNYDCANDRLTFDVQNTGQFAIGGYFIYVKDDPDKQIATIDISRNNTDAINPMLHSLLINGIKLGMTDPYLTQENDFAPGAQETERYTMVGVPEPIYTLEIVPIRWQEENGKPVLASCKEVRIVEEVPGCTQACTPVDPCGDRECGTMLNNCYDEVPCGDGCGVGDFCDSTGHCVTPEDCSHNCNTLGYICGTWTICGDEVTCGTLGGACADGLDCSNGLCVDSGSTCDGEWNPGEESPGIECDDSSDPNCVGCLCLSGYESDGTGGCVEEGGAGSGCISHCLSLGVGYTRSTCVNPVGMCTNTFNGFLEPGGNYLCTEGPVRCCCGYPL